MPLQRAEERQATRQQQEEVYELIRPVAREAALSTVWVWASGRQVAMGTVVGGGDKVLTKWSEIAFSNTPIQVVGGDRRTATATVLGVYRDEDVALLQLEGATFEPIRWSEEEGPTLGRFLVAAGARVNEPLNLGVVAVTERTLRDADQAYIGITLDVDYDGEGVKVGQIDDESGAKAAGIRRGDVLVEVAGREITSPFELRNVLLDFSPEDRIDVVLMREGEQRKVEVVLGGRPEFPGVPEGRLRTMRRMGGPISLIGKGFPMAIQTDMQLRLNQCGGPVVDLEGRVVGMTIARTDRTRSFILPASHIRKMLGEAPLDPSLAQLDQGNAGPQPMAGPQPRAVPMNPEAAGRLQRHLEEMSRFLDRLDREMSRIGE